MIGIFLSMSICEESIRSLKLQLILRETLRRNFANLINKYLLAKEVILKDVKYFIIKSKS